MKIKVDDITEKPKLLSFEEPFDVFPSLVEIQKAGGCVFLAPLSIELKACKEYDHLRVSGSVTSKIRVNCSRCLTSFDSDLDLVFTIFYTEANRLGVEEEELELAEEDLVSVSYVGNEIDFSSEVAEQVIMELPLKPLCNDECKGLCPSCGVDLNEVDCECERSVFNLKFSALKNFRVDS
ncbi:MAG: DUF177 domain-containing protein [Desulfuromonadales bacterium]|nr:MAG: DUF177 domain-containing protein [Desulfuromonadales bacterium]